MGNHYRSILQGARWIPTKNIPNRVFLEIIKELYILTSSWSWSPDASYFELHRPWKELELSRLTCKVTLQLHPTHQGDYVSLISTHVIVKATAHSHSQFEEFAHGRLHIAVDGHPCNLCQETKVYTYTHAIIHTNIHTYACEPTKVAWVLGQWQLAIQTWGRAAYRLRKARMFGYVSRLPGIRASWKSAVSYRRKSGQVTLVPAENFLPCRYSSMRFVWYSHFSFSFSMISAWSSLEGTPVWDRGQVYAGNEVDSLNFLPFCICFQFLASLLTGSRVWQGNARKSLL